MSRDMDVVGRTSTGRTKVMACSNSRCIHDFQNKKYNGRRVFNAMGTPIKGWRCTVCSNEVMGN